MQQNTKRSQVREQTHWNCEKREEWLVTDQIQSQRWTSRIWGPARFCLWLGKGGHMRDLLHLASAGGCSSSGGAGTRKRRRSATGRKQRQVLLWLLPTPRDPSYQTCLARSHAQEPLQKRKKNVLPTIAVKRWINLFIYNHHISSNGYICGKINSVSI